jgi:transposase
MSAAVPPVVIRCIRLIDQQVVLEVEGGDHQARCPLCGVWSDRRHGSYARRPLDLPWRGQVVRVLLTVRRFRCRVANCARQTFAEDFSSLVPKHGRRTVAATALLTSVAQELGGEAGARVARAGGLPVSPDTLLRILRQSATPCGSAPRVLGVDDFAFRRRHHYGTILVDMETHRPIDLLGDRTADTLATWLREHPGVEIIVRDRSGAYAEGGRAGAPQAIQVADRFHLIQNGSQALEEFLRGRPRRVVFVTGPDPPAPSAPDQSTPAPPGDEAPPALELLSAAKRQQVERAAARVARWQEVHDRRARGHGLRQIAREMHLARMTVRRLLDRPRPTSEPVRRPGRPGGLTSPKLQPYVSHLEARWQAGCTNVRQLHQELTNLGYEGSYSLLEQALRPSRLPRPPSRDRKANRRRRQLSVRWLCLRPPESLKEEERIALEQVFQDDSQLALGYQLVQRFHQIVADREIAALEPWLIAAEQSNLAPFVILAHGIRMDRSAVNAALTTPWSNGTVEGHVHRLKLIKRQGYGRAKTDLLRRRVVAA